jgi:NADH-quinone oxidoreductase subunit J
MTPLGLLFYLFGAIILAAAGLAVTRRNPVHAICCAVVTFLATGALMTVLGAPLPGVLMVVVYAGAIMVLFLFILMLLGLRAPDGRIALKRLVLPGILGAATVVSLLVLVGHDPKGQVLLPAAMAGPAVVGHTLFSTYWLAVEGVSVLLFAALAAVILLGRGPKPVGQTGGQTP